MAEKKKRPAIRFKGFEGDWEQRKLDDFLIGRNEQIPMSTEYPLMAFVAYEGVSPKGERYDRSFLVSDVENKLYKKTELGDFIYSSNNLEAGSIGLNKYGKATISPVYSIFHSTSLADSDFLGRRLIQKDIVNAMIRWRQGVIYGQWRIHESDFLKIEIYAPSFQEQLEIGAFFDNLDHLITLHQRKHEKLKIFKKAMLEKMFPKNGEKIPEVRLPGFEGDWEQRKLGEVARINGRIGFRGYTVKDITSKEKGGVLAYSPSNIINNQLYINNGNTYITRNKYEESPEIMISNGDILFVKTGSTLGKSTLVKGLQEDATLNPQVIVIRVKKNIEQFFSAMLITKRIFRQVESSKIGGAVPTITETQIKNFDIIQPFFDEEKRKIGMFFSNLDHLITLHQRKVEKLQIVKESMLEKMFV